jgi:hypothetical protein
MLNNQLAQNLLARELAQAKSKLTPKIFRISSLQTNFDSATKPAH